ncbi:MAG TPA: ribonuclease P protein component [Rhodocyclaceae bacterium]|nr:ribonuclease P protein component [Rhodocyclaceae bacterium]
MTRVETDATFPRRVRLLTPNAFTAVFEKRSVRRGRFFHLHAGADKTIAATGDLPASPPLARLGIAVPKKLLKTAVHRNVVKRIAREVFRQTRLLLDRRDYVLRLAVKIDPKRQLLDRKALAQDIRALLVSRQTRQAADRGPVVAPRPPAGGASC